MFFDLKGIEMYAIWFVDENGAPMGRRGGLNSVEEAVRTALRLPVDGSWFEKPYPRGEVVLLRNDGTPNTEGWREGKEVINEGSEWDGTECTILIRPDGRKATPAPEPLVEVEG